MSNQEKLLGQAQMFQQQLQSIMFQKETLGLQLSEIKKAVEELEKSKEASVFKIAGPILVKTGKKEIKTDLDEKEEAINLRIKLLEKNEIKLNDKINEIRDSLTKKVGG